MVYQLQDLLSEVRSKHPLVHHITNYVTVNDCANICICSGGSPVMTDAEDDIIGMTPIANAVVLNMGTLNPRTVEAMVQAGKIAKQKGIPVIFDPVGVGATDYRNKVAVRIIEEVRPDVIKGNAGEISFLAGIEGGVRGVDSTASGDVGESVKKTAQRYGCIVASSGVKDYVSDGKDVFVLSNGHDMQGNVSGTGCMLSSVLGSYVGACGVKIESVVAGITSFNIAAEKAAKDCKGPGSFKVGLFDCLFGLKYSDIECCAKIEKL